MAATTVPVVDMAPLQAATKVKPPAVPRGAHFDASREAKAAAAESQAAMKLSIAQYKKDLAAVTAALKADTKAKAKDTAPPAAKKARTADGGKKAKKAKKDEAGGAKKAKKAKKDEAGGGKKAKKAKKDEAGGAKKAKKAEAGGATSTAVLEKQRAASARVDKAEKRVTELNAKLTDLRAKLAAAQTANRSTKRIEGSIATAEADLVKKTASVDAARKAQQALATAKGGKKRGRGGAAAAAAASAPATGGGDGQGAVGQTFEFAVPVMHGTDQAPHFELPLNVQYMAHKPTARSDLVELGFPLSDVFRVEGCTEEGLRATIKQVCKLYAGDVTVGFEDVAMTRLDADGVGMFMQ